MNNQFPKSSNPSAAIRLSQFTAAGLMFGIIVFGGIALVTQTQQQPRPPLFAYIAVLFAAQIVALRYFIPGLVIKSRLYALKRGESASIPGQLLFLYQIRMIAELAMIEMAAFLNLVAYITERQWFSLAVAGFMLALMAAMFPTLNKYEIWTAEVQQSLNSQF